VKGVNLFPSGFGGIEMSTKYALRKCKDARRVCIYPKRLFLSSFSLRFFASLYFLVVFLFFPFLEQLEGIGSVRLGVDQVFSPMYEPLLFGKRIGLVTNHTGINSEGESTIALFKKNATLFGYTLEILFSPEHGLNGVSKAGENVTDDIDADGIPVLSLHGASRRPSPQALAKLSLIVFDIQDIGSRSYTYVSTLLYVMEEAAKAEVPVVVLDRPNPLGGIMVDGPILEEKWRSFVGYMNVPYCHGMTVGELAQYFNLEYGIGCKLVVVPMHGWKRSMTFDQTGLIWIPTSPHVPDFRTAFYYPATGILGELSIASIGIGTSLPFRLTGAPWMNAQVLAKEMNALRLPGVYFSPYDFSPFFGRFAHEVCHGVLITITDVGDFLPVTTQYSILAVLKNLYPKEFKEGLENSKGRMEMFNKVNGCEEVGRILLEERYCLWKLRSLCQKDKSNFMLKRRAYLYPEY
jgi:uncharacterized protein YbbC (DUF1343 family)